jgi:ATP adenylyltransferase/5',5'''-P-1,P-4-tetraphosphate phosphorylase II
VNPFPILEEHFTIPLNEHKDQEIKPYIEDLLDFTKIMDQHVLLYNGPQCGASAPDHIHFQAVRKGQLPFEEEWKNDKQKTLVRITNSERWKSFRTSVADGIHIQAGTKNAAQFSSFRFTHNTINIRKSG